MRIISARDYDHMSRQAANIISAQVILKPNSVLGLATGSSPIGTYKQLIEWYKKGDIDFSQVHTVNLDSMWGWTTPATRAMSTSCATISSTISTSTWPTPTFPRAPTPDARAECTCYDNIIRSLGGIDLQLLGLGPNGHIGFNEPDDSFTKGHPQGGPDRRHHPGQQALL